MYFKKVLIANRGEIVSRIIKTLHKLHIKSVVIYDEREKNCQYVLNANESYCLGTGTLDDTFLNIDKIIRIAVETGCDAIHPGYGFLSENSEFSLAVINARITFIGPPPNIITLMGNKITANQFVEKIGLPVIPCIRGDIKEIIAITPVEFFPCIIKVAAGGGGKGMYVATDYASLKSMLKKASDEAERYFNNNEVYVEKYFEKPRHIEVQILADKFGNIIHLFERECSIQRRFQKIIEESPSTYLDQDLRERITNSAVKIAYEANYVGAGTIEFLVDAQKNHYFLEMNTRIQVEHPVTEMVTGIDIVEEQIAIAASEDIASRIAGAISEGHSIETRIYAEEPDDNYQPSPGKVSLIDFPERPYLRIDKDIISGDFVLSDFDPMIAKIIVRGKNRMEAIQRISAVLNSSHIHGIKTNIQQLIEIFSDEDFITNNISTNYLNTKKFSLQTRNKENIARKMLMLGTAIWLSIYKLPQPDGSFNKHNMASVIGHWRIYKDFQVYLNNVEYKVRLVQSQQDSLSCTINDELFQISTVNKSDSQIISRLNNLQLEYYYSWNENSYQLSISTTNIVYQFHRSDLFYPFAAINSNVDETIKTPAIYAPITGRISKIFFEKGEMVSKGETIISIESMKMENEIKMQYDGVINETLVKPGEIVTEGKLLFRLEFKD